MALLLELPSTGQSAWSATVDTLGRYCEHVLTRHGDVPEVGKGALSWRDRLDAALPVLVQETLGPELPTFALLGQRVAELHAALAALTDRDFVPEDYTQADQRSLYQAARTESRRACQRLRKRMKVMPESIQPLAQAVLDSESDVLGRLRAILDGKLVALKQRIHGQLSLARIMWTGKDFVLMSPGGDPAWSLSERRRKRSPLYDVAALLHSFAHAAWTAAREGNIRVVDLPALEPWLDVWQEGSSLAFVQSYLEAAGGHSFLPDRQTCARLLDFFLLERAMSQLHDALGQPERKLQAVLEATSRLIQRGA